jgi:hypothetical protein
MLAVMISSYTPGKICPRSSLSFMGRGNVLPSYTLQELVQGLAAQESYCEPHPMWHQYYPVADCCVKGQTPNNRKKSFEGTCFESLNLLATILPVE